MEIRKYDYKLEKELNNCGSFLSICFNTEHDVMCAAEEVSKQYTCIVYRTENEKYYNIAIPACKDGNQLFDSKYAHEYGKEICLKYHGGGFVTNFGDLTSFDEQGELIGWMDGSWWEDDVLFFSDEIMALQLCGIDDKTILGLDRENFNVLTQKLGDTYDESKYNARRLLKKEDNANIYTITYCESCYPEMLKVLGDERPPILHYIGDEELLERTDSIAIIGARNADRKGYEVAYSLGADAAKRDKVVISGLALGCDAAAHRGCLDAGGKTIAIVATGLDIVHPKEHKSLQEEIVKSGGLVISEHPIGVKANPTRLVARNRLQAALAEKVVVAQCPIKSGTMYTVEFAEKYGKKIYAAEFNKENEYNSGNCFLLKENKAKPISILWSE